MRESIPRWEEVRGISSVIGGGIDIIDVATIAGSFRSRDRKSASSLKIQARLVMTREAFWPPKPKLFESAVRIGISREVFGT